MNRSVRITNLIQSAVFIEDIGVRLAWKGSSSTVSLDVANRSKSLSIAIKKKQVSKTIVSNSMPPRVWPFPKEKIRKTEEPDSRDREISNLRGDIKGLQGQLSAILQAVQDGNSRPIVMQQGAPGAQGQPLVDHDDPMFIPSQIVPDERTTESRINVKSDEVEVEDFDEAASALKRLRKNKGS